MPGVHDVFRAGRDTVPTQRLFVSKIGKTVEQRDEEQRWFEKPDQRAATMPPQFPRMPCSLTASFRRSAPVHPPWERYLLAGGNARWDVCLHGKLRHIEHFRLLHRQKWSVDAIGRDRG